MADNNNIKDFTAADIERYWSGKMNTAEMHALEKAAMDDPFLDDALEGYRNATTPLHDIDLLKGKIDTRIGAAPVVNMKKKRIGWLRVAAAVIIIAGAGLMLQQNVFNKQEKAPIAVTQNNEEKKQEAASADQSVLDTAKQKTEPVTEPAKVQNIPPVTTTTDQLTTSQPRKLSLPSGDIELKDSVRISNDKAEPLFAKPDIKTEDKREETSLRRLPKDFKSDTINAKTGDKYYSVEQNRNSSPELKSRSNEGRSGVLNSGYISNNYYKYRVVDAQNNPVPFANVFNTRDNIGTYTDVKGNFNLLSTDSVMDVQIRSLGYNSTNYRLVPSTQQNSLVLQEDQEARRQITPPNAKVVGSVVRKDSAELIEPEVGWGNYNTYIANNIQIPDNLRAKSNANNNVELSFDVDRNGNPTNIKITKSSQCKACDDEAIRLLKDGPKWKRKGKAKKNKTTISIAVDQ